MAHGGSITPSSATWAWVVGVFGLFGVLAFPMGVWGFYRYSMLHPAEHAYTGTIFDWLYHTLQLYILHGVHLEHEAPWQLNFARFLAPAFTVYGLYRALLLAFQEPLRSIRLRLMCQHVLLVGDGALALRLATDLCAHGRRVVVVGTEARREAFLALRRRCSYVSTDLAEPLRLDTLRAQTSTRVLLAARDDQLNIGAATQLVEFFGAHQQHTMPPCHVHLFDFSTRQLFTGYRLSKPEARCLATFNIYDDCARDVLDRWPLDRVTITAGSPLVVRLVVVGFGKMGESLALQAAKLGHFANGRRLEILVLDREAEERQASFEYRYPRFHAVCDIEFRSQDLRKAQAIQELRRLLADQERLQTLAFCINNSALHLPLVLDLFADLYRLHVPALVRTSAADGLAPLLNTPWDGVPLAQMLHPFNVLDSSVSQPFLAGAMRDNLARVIHEDFRARRRREGRPEDDPSMQPWERLGPDLQESNRQQADHIKVKLRAIGCTSSNASADQSLHLQPFQGFTPAEVEILARLEHARWNAERFLAGWQHGSERNERARTSPYLVSWEELPEEVREYDREAVRNIPALLQQSGASINR